MSLERDPAEKIVWGCREIFCFLVNNLEGKFSKVGQQIMEKCKVHFTTSCKIIDFSDKNC